MDHTNEHFIIDSIEYRTPAWRQLVIPGMHLAPVCSGQSCMQHARFLTCKSMGKFHFLPAALRAGNKRVPMMVTLHCRLLSCKSLNI